VIHRLKRPSKSGWSGPGKPAPEGEQIPTMGFSFAALTSAATSRGAMAFCS
jgi:hypothetical protein